jgi:DNA-binding transcriptional ArsR family regulator
LKRLSLVEELKIEALKILKESEVPLCVGDVAKRLGVTWSTARAILLTLEAEGLVKSLKTSKSKIYFAKERELKVK